MRTQRAISFISIFIFLIVLTAYPGHLSAQSIWMHSSENKAEIGTQLLIPSFDRIESDFPFALYLYTHLPLSGKVELQVDVPLSHFSNGGGEANLGLGNPYVGIQYGNPGGSLALDLGARLPLAEDDSGALTTGLLSEDYMVTPFSPNAYSIVSTIHYTADRASGWTFKVGGGPEIALPEEGDGGELFVKYYGQIRYQVSELTVGGGITGQVLATEENLSYDERSLHDLGLIGSYDLGGATVGSFLQFPMDDTLNDFVNLVWGLNVALEI